MKKNTYALINTFTALLLLMAVPSLGSQHHEPGVTRKCVQRFSNLSTWKKIAIGAGVACTICGLGVGIATKTNLFSLGFNNSSQEEIAAIVKKDTENKLDDSRSNGSNASSTTVSSTTPLYTAADTLEPSIQEPTANAKMVQNTINRFNETGGEE